MPETSNEKEDVNFIETDADAQNGQNKCPKCGATDISLKVKNGKLRCNFCRHEFDAEKFEDVEKNINELEGTFYTSGTKDIIEDSKDIITLKCSSCGAEVVIDTSESAQARCHWCRNMLSINEQIPNGSIPDAVLPFKLTKEEAKSQIENFVNKRKFYANTKFKEEFTTENIMGVYFPYMIVDVNSHASLSGTGEHLVRRYTVGDKENRRTLYDADLYEVERDFDLTIEGLTVESSIDKLNKKSEDKTTNIINSIMPFDIENCEKWNANFLRGFSSEKRDTNVEFIRPLVKAQAKDIARFAANESLTEYDRGVKWDKEELDVKGEKWKAAYLPVWLYSYRQLKGSKSVLHYVAVNARTKETMGSVPINTPKLFLVSLIIEIICCILGFSIMMADEDAAIWGILLGFVGFIYYWIMHGRYRNSDARHRHELETKKNVSNLKKKDNLIKRLTGLSNSKMNGANNTRING